MEAYDKETKEGKPDLIHGKFEHMVETASKVAGLTRNQYEEWRETEKLEEKEKWKKQKSIQKEKEEERIMGTNGEREKRSRREETGEEHKKNNG